MEKKKGSPKKIGSVLGNIFIWVFIAFSVFMTVIAFAAQSSPDGVPTIGKSVILVVQTPSMSPTIEEGDIIIGNRISLEAAAALKEQDIITFVTDDLDGDNKRDLNTHRIISVNTPEFGEVSYITKGDNNPIEDSHVVYASDVISIYDGTRIKGLGKVFNFLQSPNGFLITIVIPLLLFFVLEIYLFVKKVQEVKNAGKKQITAADEELIKQKAVEEYLKAQQESQKAAEEEAARKAAEEERIKKEAIEEYLRAQEAANKKD